MGFKLETINELTCLAEGSGILFAKKGSRIADVGNFRYSKMLLGTNKGSLLSQIGNHIARKFTGENLEIMEISGNGQVYLADQGAHVHCIHLEPSGPWKEIYVESEDLLAFTETCKYSVDIVPAGAAMNDLFKSKLTYNGEGACVVIKTEGNPIMLEAPCRVDPDALVAWTGAKPSVEANVDVIKSLFGQSNGESYLLKFAQPGQKVIVQPFERTSGIGVNVDSGGRNSYNSYNGR